MMPRTRSRRTKDREPAKAPRWSSFKTVKELLEGLWQYMSDNSHFGARDTEPKYDVRGALRKFEEFKPSFECRWELYSTMKDVGQVNINIGRAVTRAIKLTKELGFGADAVVGVWNNVADMDW